MTDWLGLVIGSNQNQKGVKTGTSENVKSEEFLMGCSLDSVVVTKYILQNLLQSGIPCTSDMMNLFPVLGPNVPPFA